MARKESEGNAASRGSKPHVRGALVAGASELPRNAAWLLTKALGTLSSPNGGDSGGRESANGTPAPRVLESAVDAMRSTRAIVKDALPGGDSVEDRVKRAHAAADHAREAEQRAVGSSERADRAAQEVDQAEGEGRHRVEAARVDNQAEADRRIEEFRAEQQERVERHVAKIADDARVDVGRKRGVAEKAREEAEADYARATELLAEARRLSDEASTAAHQVAKEAQREADRLVGAAHSSEGAVKKTAKPTQRSTSRKKPVVSSQGKAPARKKAAATGRLDARRKDELQELAAAKGIEGRAAMTKAELVKALR